MNNYSDMHAKETATLNEETPSKSALLRLRDVLNQPKLRLAGAFLSKIIYRVDRIFGDLVAIILGLGIAMLWMATSVLESQSTDLTVLRPNFKIWFADVFNGHDAEFSRLELAWLPAEDQIVATIEGAEIRGKDGEILERFDLVRSTLELHEDFSVFPRLVNVEIEGGVITYHEDANGQITAGLGPPETVGRVGPIYRSEQPTQSEGNVRSILQGLEFIQIRDAKFYVLNEVSGIDIKSDVELLRANFSKNGGLAVTAMGTVAQNSGPMPFSVDAISDSEFEGTRVRLDVAGARLDEIGPKKGRFWEFRGLAAPVDLIADVDFSRSKGLQSASVAIDVKSGKFVVLREESSRTFPIDSLIARASLVPGNERMDIGAFDLKAPNLSFESSGFLTQLQNLSDGDENSSPIFDLSLDNISVDLTPVFSIPTKINALKITGQADVDSRKLEISSGRLDVFDSVHEFDGTLRLEDNNSIKSLKFKSDMSGMLTPSQFLSLWPVNSFAGARGWIEGAILDADITLLDSEVEFDETFFETRELTPERLKFRFGGSDVTVRYMQTLPPATNVSGVGEIIGNKLSVSIEEGQVGAIELTGGSTTIPKLRPKNGDIIVTINGQGTASDLLHLADYPPFQIASRYNVDPDKVSGAGDIVVTVQRALTPFLPPDQIDYKVKGDFEGVSAPFEFGQYSITNGNVTLDANRVRALISGPVDIGPWRADLRWLETFGDNPPPTQYSALGRIDADVLDKFGFASRTWFDGSAELRIDAIGRGTDVLGGNIEVDLTESELTLDRIWLKPVGEIATLRGLLKRAKDNSYQIENIRLNGRDIDVSGEVHFESNHKLSHLDFSKVSISSLIDGAVKITPDREAGRLGIELDADYLNVSPWTEDLFVERQSNLDVPLVLQGTVENLILAETYPVTSSTFFFSHTGDVIETASLEGLSEQEPITLALNTRSDLKRQFKISVPNASKALSAFVGLSNTTGGQLDITASLPAAGEAGAYVGEADMRDFRLNEAPALAQLLSLASLTGLADTLTSGSMQFDRFKVPFAMLGDDIAIRDARLYGPAIGMTGNGDINLEQRTVDFDGTLVPSYTANSILGDIPLLGDLFIQEKDGGLFALTYTVDGPFEQMQITVNPLSALTPGFLRGIFKRDRSEIDDAMKEAIQDVQPKQDDPIESE